VLLLLGWYAPQTEACIVSHARKANWSLEHHAVRTGLAGGSPELDGILCILGGWESRPELTEFVRQAGVPTVDMHADEAVTVPAGRVLMDNVAMGGLAADHFIERLMEGEPIPPDPILIPPLGVTTRRSTDILAVADPRVATALSYIRQHFADDVVDSTNVADTCGVPPRTLARLFHQHLGRSIAGELRQVRLHHARQLLSTTDFTASEIAHQCGFSNLLHFRRNLERQTGEKPRQWRRSHAP
jgi:AraC-like DNA-binding protein